MLIEQRSTLADLKALLDLPEHADKRFELRDGVIVEVNPPKPVHAYTSLEFYSAMREYGRKTGAGLAFGDNVGYDLPNGDSLIPDASFVAKVDIHFPLPDAFDFAPLVVVEVASPSNTERELLDKVESFLNCGTQLAWIAYIKKRSVDAVRLDADGRLVIRPYNVNQVLDGEDVLPGFQLPVKDVFPPQGAA
jgi:Uma2 family endonuclease